MFAHELGHKVVIHTSGETGEVIGRAQFTGALDQYLIRYKDGQGIAVEKWWQVDALGAVSLKKPAPAAEQKSIPDPVHVLLDGAHYECNTKHVLLVGPKHIGKTYNARRIAAHFGCERIADDWDGYTIPLDMRVGTLFITNTEPAMIPVGTLHVSVATKEDFDTFMAGLKKR